MYQAAHQTLNDVKMDNQASGLKATKSAQLN